MKLEEMILVTVNRKGMETNYLSTAKDYLKLLTEIYHDNVTDLSEAIDGLYRTKQDRTFSEVYAAPNQSYYAKFCSNEGELKCFVSGILDEGKAVFDEDGCSPECFEVLKAYGIGRDGCSQIHSLHYEAKEYGYRRGEILHNLNGCDYRVLSVLSERNLLLMAQSDGQYILAVNTVMYERSPKEEFLTENNVIRGVEWGHGIYLGHDLMKIDLDGIIQEYGRPVQINSIEDYRDEVRWQFVKLKSLAQNERIAQVVRWAAEKELSETFRTRDREVFERNLDKGNYDKGFCEPEKEKSR